MHEVLTAEGFVSPSEIDDQIRKMVGKYRGGSGAENVAIQKARGVIETGLYPEFIAGASCPEIAQESKIRVRTLHEIRRLLRANGNQTNLVLPLQVKFIIGNTK